MWLKDNDQKSLCFVKQGNLKSTCFSRLLVMTAVAIDFSKPIPWSPPSPRPSEGLFIDIGSLTIYTIHIMQ